MKKIRLLRLILRNFKGCEFQEFVFDGESKDIYGANESGKSTIYSAICWLLSGKDEFDRKDYEIKNTAKKELNSQSHEVEAWFDVDGRNQHFKRVYLEKWVKPKGKSQKEFEGHTTDFWHNDAPCKLKDYQTEVDSMIPANLVKLLTNVYFFNNLPWESQRQGLLSISGGITDKEVIEKIATPENDFATLILALNSGKTIEKYKAELKGKLALLEEKKVQYPYRIDEAKKGKPETQDWEKIQEEMNVLNGELQEIDGKLTNQFNLLTSLQQELLADQKKLGTLQTNLNNRKQAIKTQYTSQNSSSDDQIGMTKTAIQTTEKKIFLLEKTIQDNKELKVKYEQQLTEKNTKIEECRTGWDIANQKKFEFDETKCVCPTCLRALEADDIDKQREQMRTNFNTAVMNEKQEWVNKSNLLKQEVQKLNENISLVKEQPQQLIDLQSLKDQLQQEKNSLQVLEKANEGKEVIDVDKAVQALVDNDDEAKRINAEIEALNIVINGHHDKINGRDTSAEDMLKNLKTTTLQSLDVLKDKMALKTTIEKAEERIKELENEEQVNAQSIADVEKNIFEILTFTRAKMDILTNKVNSKFKYVSFRLFDKQVNGEIADTCVCEYKDVPYPTLNTAAKVLAGIDVLNTLSEFYQISAFVFVDNRESSTWIPETQSQVISLHVSPPDIKLRMA